MKLVSLNIEKRNHVDRVKAFLEKERADVVALMEVGEEDLDTLLTEYPHRLFGANFRLEDRGVKAGVVLAARLPMVGPEVYYADGQESESVPLESMGVGIHRPVVVMARVSGIRLAATHFTWTPEMSETDKQRKDLTRLLEKLNNDEMVLCGDFNIPRGSQTYEMLAKRYLDNVPKEVTTTIDFELHRAKKEGKPKFEAVVDYIWTTSDYRVTEVRLENGISDHYGLVGEVAYVL